MDFPLISPLDCKHLEWYLRYPARCIQANWREHAVVTTIQRTIWTQWAHAYRSRAHLRRYTHVSWEGSAFFYLPRWVPANKARDWNLVEIWARRVNSNFPRDTDFPSINYLKQSLTYLFHSVASIFPFNVEALGNKFQEYPGRFKPTSSIDRGPGSGSSLPTIPVR